MENENIGKRGMGINYKGSQGQTKRAVVLQEEEEEEEEEECHSLPALWNIKSKDYINRVTKMNNTNICFANI
jgi:hypothetical protein